MKNAFSYPVPEFPAVGTMTIFTDGQFITAIRLGGVEIPGEIEICETPLLRHAREELGEYFTGRRSAFTFPALQSGTEFQQRVWNALQNIPYGETRSYGQIARSLGRPGAARAVGMANNRNRLPILIPCHRVIGADGKLVGYEGGLTIKAALLELERKYR